MKKIKESKCFCFHSYKTINYIYIIKYILLFLIDIFFKIFFSFFGKKIKKKKYYISICAIFKNEAPYMKEWIEYYLLIGIDHFYLYNNNSEDDYKSILQPYIDKGLVTLTEWPDIPGQISAYKNWYENYRYETNWCTFIDLDEFICPLKDLNLKEWMKRHNKYPVYAIYWKMFGTSGIIEPDKSKLIIEQYVGCWDKISEATKIIYNTDYDIERFFTSMMHKFNVKYLGLYIPPINSFGYFINSWDINRCGNKKIDIQCNHYWSKSYNDYIVKHKKGDAVWEKGISIRNMKMFLWNEHFNRSRDYNIQRFLVELKLRMLNKK